MKRFLTKMTMALALGGSLLAAAVPAEAQSRGHGGGGWHGGGGGGWHGGGGYRGGGYGYRGYGYRGYYPGAAIGAGILGLAVGAAIADRPAYAYPYPAYSAYPAYPPAPYGYGYYGY